MITDETIRNCFIFIRYLFAINLQLKEVLRLQNASASNLLITIALAGTEESNFNKFGSGRLKIEMKSSTQ